MASNSFIESKLRKETDYELHREAQRHIAQGYLTNSKRPQSLVMGVYPTHLKRGKGCYVWDYSDRKFVDYITALGTNLFGYANESIIEPVKAVISDGNLFSLASKHEIDTSVALKALFPFVDCFKFLKTGTDACVAAIRIARAKTGREIVLSEGYHGWSDGFVSLSPPAYGTLKHDSLAYHKLLASQINETVAAVIIEPVMTDASLSRIEFLKDLRERCTKTGTVLIFDEIITGFRFPKYCVANHYGIYPDLICLGKAMANGFPLSAVGGKYDTMNCKEYFVSSTYASCTDAMVACQQVCTLLHKGYKIETIWDAGLEFIQKFNSFWPEGIKIEGYPTRGVFKGDPLVTALFFQEACFAGFLFGPSWWMNFPLAQVSKNFMGTIREIVIKVRDGRAKLVGQMPQSPFSQRVRDEKKETLS